MAQYGPLAQNMPLGPQCIGKKRKSAATSKMSLWLFVNLIFAWNDDVKSNFCIVGRVEWYWHIRMSYLTSLNPQLFKNIAYVGVFKHVSVQHVFCNSTKSIASSIVIGLITLYVLYSARSTNLSIMWMSLGIRKLENFINDTTSATLLIKLRNTWEGLWTLWSVSLPTISPSFSSLSHQLGHPAPFPGEVKDYNFRSDDQLQIDWQPPCRELRCLLHPSKFSCTSSSSASPPRLWVLRTCK